MLSLTDIIRKAKRKLHPRQPIPELEAEDPRHDRQPSFPSPTAPLSKQPQAGPSTTVNPNNEPHGGEDEMTTIRRLLRPPTIEGLHDWGIPPASQDPCDPALTVGSASVSHLHVSSMDMYKFRRKWPRF